MSQEPGRWPLRPVNALLAEGRGGDGLLPRLEDVLRKADRKIMAAVATRIRGKIAWTAGEYELDRSFLQAYYTALRGRLETRMLLGRRKRDKFDRD
jgi:hypothetical protein